jgi:peroxiredoxin
MLGAMDESKAPAVGAIAPDFELPSSAGKVCRLTELVAGGLAVVVFYRGHW